MQKIQLTWFFIKCVTFRFLKVACSRLQLSRKNRLVISAGRSVHCTVPLSPVEISLHDMFCVKLVLDDMDNAF